MKSVCGITPCSTGSTHTIGRDGSLQNGTMRTYRVPQGLNVSIEGDRHSLDKVARYLDAHARRCSEDALADWAIRYVSGPAPAVANFAADRELQAFGDVFQVASADDGTARITHPDTSAQIWRLRLRTVDIVAPPRSRSYGVVQSMYAAVRQIQLLAASEMEMAVLHAAAVAVEQGVLLLCGPKGAGKTTLALAFMGRGAAYMSSDRTILWRTQDGARAAGWMGTFRIARDGIGLVLDEYRAGALMRYMNGRHAPDYWFGGKFRFPPHDLLRLCAWPSQQLGVPRFLVELDPAESGAVNVVPMSHEQLRAAWHQNVVAGVPLLSTGAAAAMDVPPSLRGLRVRGRAAPHVMADRVMQFLPAIQGGTTP
jgi:hypothetical protein